MSETHSARVAEFQRRMADDGIDVAVLTDPDTVYYLSGAFGYLGVEFGRPTMVVAPRDAAPTLITPLMESEMVGAQTWIDDIRPWSDGLDGEWGAHLAALLGSRAGLVVGIERKRIPAIVAEWMRASLGGALLVDVSPSIEAMRVVKSADEIAIMRQAGQVAIAMAEAAEGVIGEGVPEYEVALAVIAGGTRKAAEFLSDEGPDRFVSPTIHNLQVLQSGHDTCMVHRRSTVRRLGRGDPVYLCFCGIANFKQFKLGFDREYFVGEVSDEMARAYETTIAAQKAALDAIRPGAIAEEIHGAAEEVYRTAGHDAGYRTGRGIGYSFLEQPQLKPGDMTTLKPGMTFAVDGGVTLPGRFGTRVGDSIVVTEMGYEYLTPYAKELKVL